MNFALGAAILCVIGWIILAFVLAIPSGWVHLPLALGAVLLAKAIGEGRR